MSDMDYDEIQERAGKFRCIELPGQPIMMHMGTSYLVGDLDKAVSKLRARVADLKAENERLECLCDIQYAAGVKAGWNYYAADDHAAMQKCIEMRQRDALPRLKELRMGLNSEGEK
ncbi:hypothetical protein [Salinisphaera hydrothermalis]|uniref:Uncharacterized protein n=1 Tax=Salinisphaera hydrothermalis (strain C41B8) TaxID=1304275 RepID=A0A084INS7_SALHC|nr:hypothetical protein [Salinisphaera hydrothermalis]KEZ78361.1 hypothetical protein C41B8_05648 [Salinisphaera hydrothermalis C41B8]